MNKKIQNILIKELKLYYVHVKKKDNYYKIVAVGDIFLGKNEVEKQKKIYSPLLKYIQNNKIHAVSIKTYSIKEWQKINSQEEKK
ncbi:BolA/IbaG family iron-sulfur metabolism protein [Buchnera aphidicola]|uniref:BolA/IbaG family iron-sulfur metabolism protein n=1 Tax=Buchnera aphidicola TaxID=9 RepID=UPI0020930C86|nr:BolA/IbaG family iron-sulfur metabolism protein [Buchnera aphidicola]USS94377.1 BolA/IbaG family iron-sulfur metabolism protein [Buchnera aphidicola (Sipha maydis)]